ncbi:MAG TPA: hypothetical protein PLM49_04435, partial [Bacteroidales bacterium]|nr:hypothetical protein [Bacteroidales bacterium]
FAKMARGEANKHGLQLKISTNSVFLSDSHRASPRTIRNYIARLIESGLVEKVFHGTCRNYDIYFNEVLAPVINANENPEVPILFLNEPELHSFFKTAKRQKLPQIYLLYRHLNNQLIKKECNNQGKNDIAQRMLSSSDYCTMLLCYRSYNPLESTFCIDTGNTGEKTATLAPATTNLQNDIKAESTFCIDTGNTGGATAETDENDAIGVPAKKIMSRLKNKHIREQLRSNDIEELRYVYASILYSYAIDRIPTWRNRVYKDAAGEVIIYIAENYFNKCNNRTRFDELLLRYQLAIDVAARYIRKKLANGRWKSFWTFPATWFNINYSRGFVRAGVWVEKILEKRRKNIDRAKRLDINEKLNAILVEYFTSNDDNYSVLLARVRNTIPTREAQFKLCIANRISKVDFLFSKDELGFYKSKVS